MPATDALDVSPQDGHVDLKLPDSTAPDRLAREQAEGGALGALGVPRYARYWSGLSLSLIGVWVRITAMGYLVYDITDDPFKLGMISFAQAAPVLVTGTIAGALLDRIDRRKILLAVQAVYIAMMALVTLLVATHYVQYWHLLVISLIVGSASGFDWPARMSIIPALVPRSRLQSAVALNSVAFNASRIIGPSIAGWLIGIAGLAACFAYTTVSFVPFSVIVLTIGAISLPRSATLVKRSGFSELLEGYRYIWRTPRIRGLLSVDIVPLALGISYFTMALAIARDVLHLGSGGLGLLLAANGIGSLAGTLAVALLSGVHRRGRIVVLGVGAFGIFLILFALSSSPILSMVLIMFLGMCTATYATFNDTLIQLTVDDAYRGRVLAVYSMLWGLTPIGGLQVGWLSRSMGVQHALAINGAIIMLYMMFLWFRTPVRHID